MTKAIQKTISKPCHPKFLNEVRTLLNETLAEVPISRREKDLVILAVDEAVSSVVQYARYKGFQNQITLSVDIDEVRSKAQEEARRRREAEQTALVGTIASGLAHEIRNPLSTLRMNLQLLREDWSNPITEREQQGRKRIDVLLRETERLETIVSDFVRFAAGHALRLEPTNLNTLTGELLDFLAPQA